MTNVVRVIRALKLAGFFSRAAEMIHYYAEAVGQAGPILPSLEFAHEGRGKHAVQN